ncbi:hypothetical protein GCM10010399_64050 [Dactylosporangium fulvum]|uniref:Uncharacterized protein n=1 Tax=Dactylosporangium fulvum TaxID=53359 RepID=A0ABY5W7B1_9ACTN|nr:hypothetical protein [Dactylosporangium fulvum]UWP85772.1 hypothetical protein Dfulv_16630 [Dactylosporangium fulvum]
MNLPVLNNSPDPQVAVAMDDHGRAIIALNTAAAAALDSYLCNLPLAHDMEEDGIPDDQINTMTSLAHAIGRIVRPWAYR